MIGISADIFKLHSHIAGVDEVGRGPLAGPVVAAAVILDAARPIQGLADSKKLAPRIRESLACEIREKAIAWAIGRVDNVEIDRINILQASMLAMKLAIEGLAVIPGHVLVDGNRCPSVNFTVAAIIRGDESVPVISAASIIAKVVRDEEMIKLDKVYPGYGFERHKGYPTREHIAALEHLGICEIHRRSFAPVTRILKLTLEQKKVLSA